MSREEFDYDVHFRRYAQAYERSLAGEVQVDTIRSYFADVFLTLSAKGGVQAGRNDDKFGQTLRKAYDFYRAIGTERMGVERVEVSPIDEAHDSVRVFYVASYRPEAKGPVTIPFDVTYLIQRAGGEPKIFAFIAGDEMAAYRKHGLIDTQGRPTRRGTPSPPTR